MSTVITPTCLISPLHHVCDLSPPVLTHPAIHAEAAVSWGTGRRSCIWVTESVATHDSGDAVGPGEHELYSHLVCLETYKECMPINDLPINNRNIFRDSNTTRKLVLDTLGEGRYVTCSK